MIGIRDGESTGAVTQATIVCLTMAAGDGDTRLVRSVDLSHLEEILPIVSRLWKMILFNTLPLLEIDSESATIVVLVVAMAIQWGKGGALRSTSTLLYEWGSWV